MPLRPRTTARGWIAGARHAVDGILDVYRTQRHMRVHFVFMALNAILTVVYKLSVIETCLLMVSITLVVFAEMVNTVMEATLNIVTETYHPVAKFAKDVAAGAVLVTVINATLVGVCIYFSPERIRRLSGVWLRGEFADASAMLRALTMSVLLLLVLLTALKVGRPRGSVLRGGPVSGHTAFAFCFATCLYFLVRGTTFVYLAMLLALAIAVLATLPQIEDRSHRLRWVIYGALLGVLVPLLVFGLLARPPHG